VGRATFTIIGALAETAGIRAVEARSKHLGRQATSKRIVSETEALAISTDLSICQVQGTITYNSNSRNRWRDHHSRPLPSTG
jgi:hypothetical protein